MPGRQPNRAKRLECVELAPAVEHRRSLKAGANSTHSKRFATKEAQEFLADCEQSGLLQRNQGNKSRMREPRAHQPSIRLRHGLEWFDQDFAQHLAGAKFGESCGGLLQWIDRINYRAQLSGCRPFQGLEEILAVAAIAAD